MYVPINFFVQLNFRSEIKYRMGLEIILLHKIIAEENFFKIFFYDCYIFEMNLYFNERFIDKIFF